MDYARIKSEFDRGTLSTTELARLLSDSWAGAYRDSTPDRTVLVEVDQGPLTYLFDTSHARLVAVYGTSTAANDAYPSARMRGFPLPPLPHLVRGHVAAHSIGGGTDINLVPQDRALNISKAWRRLERLAQTRPGAFLAIGVFYDDDSQTPARFVYVVGADGVLQYEQFENG